MMDCDPLILKTVKNYAEKKGFRNVEFNVENGNIKGDGFLGIITKISATEKGNREKTIDVIVKSAGHGEASEAILTRTLFIKEIWGYQRLVPEFERLKHYTSTLRFANFVGSSLEDKREWLIMEDMTKSGYGLHRPRLETLDERYTKASLKGLAQFHAFSFIIKDRNPQLFEDMKSHCTEHILSESGETTFFQNLLSSAAEKTLELVSDDHIRYKRIKNFCTDTFKKLTELVKPREYSVICHGDYWKNNIMFQVENETVTSICPLDFQLLRYSSPTTDILYLIFNCTGKDLRSKMYRELLIYYHEEMGRFLQLYDLEIEDVYPRHVFLLEMQRNGPFGVGLAMCILPFLTCDDDAVLVVDEVVQEPLKISGNELFRKRMIDVLHDGIDLGYI